MYRNGISAITTLAINITRPFNCSDHKVEPVFPDGFTDKTKYLRLTGTRKIEKKVFEDEEFFKTDSEHCKIDEFTVLDVEGVVQEVVEPEWVAMSGKDIGIYTNLFPDANSTYSF